MEKRYLTAKETSQLLNTSPGVLANWRYRGEPPTWIKFKRRVMYDRHDLEAWINNHKVKLLEE